MSDNNLIQIRTAEKQKLIIEQLSKTPIIEVACQRIGIGRNSYYRWRKHSKKFAVSCDKAIEVGCQFINDLAESTIIQAMKDRNLTACMYWLNHRHDKYKNKVELSGNLEIPNEKLTKEQEEKIMKALELASLIIDKKGVNHEKSNKKTKRHKTNYKKTNHKS